MEFFQSAELEHIAFAHCGSEASEVLSQVDRYDFGISTAIYKSCGLLFTNPRPTPLWFGEFYQNHYRKYYQGETRLKPEQHTRPDVQLRRSSNIHYIKQSQNPEGRILDLGCGDGEFLPMFLEQNPGWQATGIEPDAELSALTRAKLTQADIDNVAFESLQCSELGRFDLITLNHVFEHILDPNELLRFVSEALSADGQLFIDVPDITVGGRGLHNLHIAHVYHYDEPILRSFLSKWGFDVFDGKRYPGDIPWTVQVLARRGESSAPWQAVHKDIDTTKRMFRIQTTRPNIIERLLGRIAGLLKG